MPLTGKLKPAEGGGNVAFPTEMLCTVIAKSPRSTSEAATRWCRQHRRVCSLPRPAEPPVNQKRCLVNARERDAVCFQDPRSIFQQWSIMKKEKKKRKREGKKITEKCPCIVTACGASHSGLDTKRRCYANHALPRRTFKAHTHVIPVPF